MAVVKNVKHIIRKPLKFLFGKAFLSESTMSKGWTTMKVIPEVLDEVPPSLVNVIYPEIFINEGMVAKPAQVRSKPKLAWNLSDTPDSMYTVCMVDPDAPSNQKPDLREWQHWLVVNIPNNKVDEDEGHFVINGKPNRKNCHYWVDENPYILNGIQNQGHCGMDYTWSTLGEVMSEYIGAGPPKETGYHRYVFVVYQQPGKITCDESKHTNKSHDGRAKFSLRKFAEKYKLGRPVAGNFFQAEFDESVPDLHKEIGF